MAAGTALSRLTGFGRTAALAAALGLTTLGDAYNAAAALPMMILVLVTGGTLSSALVPMLVRPETQAERQAVAATVLGGVAAVTAVATLAVAAASPGLGRLLSASAPPDARAARAELIGNLLLLFAPQLFLLGISVVAGALLTSAGRLARVGLTPVATNVVTLLGIGAYVLLANSPPESPQQDAAAIAALGLGATIGVAITTALQLHGCRDLLPAPRSVGRAMTRGPLRELVRISRWSLVYVVANQAGLFVVLVSAGAAIGVLSAYQWGFAVMQLPYAVIGVSVLSALYPALAREAESPTFTLLARKATGLLLLLLGPGAAALIAYGDVVAAALLGPGAANTDVALLTASVRLFALALLPFALFQLLTRICYARQAHHLPALTNLAVNLTLVLGALAASASSGADSLLFGLAAGYLASYLVGCAVLLVVVRSLVVSCAPSRALLRPTFTAIGVTAVGALLHVTGTGAAAEGLAVAITMTGLALAARAAMTHVSRSTLP